MAVWIKDFAFLCPNEEAAKLTSRIPCPYSVNDVEFYSIPMYQVLDTTSLGSCRMEWHLMIMIRQGCKETWSAFTVHNRHSGSVSWIFGWLHNLSTLSDICARHEYEGGIWFYLNLLHDFGPRTLIACTLRLLSAPIWRQWHACFKIKCRCIVPHLIFCFNCGLPLAPSLSLVL